jgi:hypothetical protein
MIRLCFSSEFFASLVGRWCKIASATHCHTIFIDSLFVSLLVRLRLGAGSRVLHVLVEPAEHLVDLLFV